MRALTAEPGRADSLRIEELPEPPASDGAVLVQGIALGICGTDREIASGAYGWSPPGQSRLVLGHESLGRVLEAPEDSGLKRGDLVVGIVRRPDPVPCAACAAGEWDMCRNGRYTERGIKERNGFGSEHFRIEPEFAVRVDPSLGLAAVLLEPTSIVAKAWEEVQYVIRRTSWKPRRCLVTGAGPVGLLAALLGVQRGFEVRVLDRVSKGPKPELVERLGARYLDAPPLEAARGAEIVIECTGAGAVVLAAIEGVASDGVVCLTGISSGGRTLPVDLSSLNRELVLDNAVVFGTVNANRRHYQTAARALAEADRRWLEAVITRRVPLARWGEAFERRDGDVKTVLQLSEA